MKKITTIYLFCLITGLLEAQDIHFTSHPAITPDAAKVVFSYASDLWEVEAKGGVARRITALDGIEDRPSISPDGQWLAFSSNQYGSRDVFLMPLKGGPIQQLTFHDAADQVESWSWDSQWIYFTSNRYNRYTTYRINIQGKTPERLFGHYHNNVHNLVRDPGGKYYFNESWESNFFSNRKRYKGAFNPDIKVYDQPSETYQELTSYDGKDFWPTVDSNGKMYFVSDQANGEYNLYTFEAGQKKQLTDFGTSIYRPQVSANGEKVVFEKDYTLHLYDTKSGESHQIEINAPVNFTLHHAQDFNVSGKITAFDVSPDHKKFAFVSRGELFVSDVKGKYVRQIPTSSQGRVREVHWMDDSKVILFNQTSNGYLNWFTIQGDAKSIEVQRSSDLQNNRNLSINHEGKEAVYLSGRKQVRIMNLGTYQSRTVVEDELWAMNNPVPTYSPDDNYILFTVMRDFERDIVVHHLATAKTTNLTNTGLAETLPYWGPDGKYIYFIANRNRPSYPYGLRDSKVYRMALEKFDRPFKSEKFDELFVEEEKEEETETKKKKNKKEDQEEEAEEEKVTVSINFDGLIERWERVGPNFGSQRGPVVIKDEEITHVLYGSDHDEGKFNLWVTTLEPFEKPKTKKIEGAETGSASIKSMEDTHYILVDGDIQKLDIDGKKLDKIDISHKFRRNLKEEFSQMFYEFWANFEENFYDHQFHGMDWTLLKEQYEKYLPFVSDRDALRQLSNDMLGELNTSHFGFRSFGDEEDIFYSSRTLNTGILWKQDFPYVVDRVVENSAADAISIDIKGGDRLVKVGGELVDPSLNREYYFLKPSLDSELTLTFSRAGRAFEVRVHPRSTFSLRSNLYDEWIDQRQQIVDEKTDGRVAYIYMKNMGRGALSRFLIEATSEAHNKDALILDLRYNTGGNVHDEVLQFLAKKEYLRWKYREGALTSQPNFAQGEKPMVLLMNEQTLSDGEMAATGFKQLGLGKLIGTETYRWIIFTSGKGLVDGSFYRLPSWGCYTLDGQNIEREGVKPDIAVRNTFKDRLDNLDPQLDRAISEILGQLKTSGVEVTEQDK